MGRVVEKMASISRGSRTMLRATRLSSRGLRIQGSSMAFPEDGLNTASMRIKEQLNDVGINTNRPIPTIFHNLTVPELYEASCSFRSHQPRAVDAKPAQVTHNGAL